MYAQAVRHQHIKASRPPRSRLSGLNNNNNTPVDFVIGHQLHSTQYTVQSGVQAGGHNSWKTALYHLFDCVACAGYVPRVKRLKIAPISIFVLFRVDDHRGTSLPSNYNPISQTSYGHFLQSTKPERPQAGKTAASEIVSSSLVSHWMFSFCRGDSFLGPRQSGD